jgi:putative restriction endonuclease
MKRTTQESRYGALWSREELILAFELYCRIPFQKTKANNPAVKELADLMGRTQASVARKLGNFGAFDPALQKLDISSLTHTGKLDREIWDVFRADWNSLVWEAKLLAAEIPNELRDMRPSDYVVLNDTQDRDAAHR